MLPRQHPSKFHVLSILILWGSPNSFAQADPSSYFVHAGLSVQSFRYQETDAHNNVLDREAGLLPGLVIEAGKHLDRYSGLISASLHKGTIPYDGQTQGGSPLMTETRERIVDVAALIKTGIGPYTDFPWLSAGFGYREWRRDIQPTNSAAGLFETYRWPYWMIGLTGDVFQKGLWKAGLDWRLMRPIHPTIELDANDFDPLTLSLGSTYSFNVGFPIEYRAGTKQTVVIRPYWQSWHLRQGNSKRLYSNGIPTDYSAHEPDSETRILGITATLRFAH